MQKELVLTAASEDYLEAIYNLCRFGKAAHSRDISESLGVHKSTVTAALKSLGQQGLINYSRYEAVTLTTEGEKLAGDVARRHRALKEFFVGVLLVDNDMAEKAACGMEHAIPRTIVDKLIGFADFIKDCPCTGYDSPEDSASGQPGGVKAAWRCSARKAAGKPPRTARRLQDLGDEP